MSAAIRHDRAQTPPDLQVVPQVYRGAQPRVSPRLTAKLTPAKVTPAPRRHAETEPSQALAELDTLLAAAVANADDLTWLTAHAATYPLLTAAQERRLSHAIHASRAGKSSKSSALWAKQARERLTLCNLRLVINMARRMLAMSGDLELSDLIQEGVTGLMHAVEKYDASKGYRFSTYATWWIAQAIHRSIAQGGHAIRLPVYLYERRKQLLRLRARLLEEQQREPSLDELVAAYESEPVKNGVREAGRTLAREDVALLLLLQEPILSVSRPVKDSGDGAQLHSSQQTFGDLIPDEVAAAAYALVEANEDARWILDVARYTLRDNLRMYDIWLARTLAASGDGMTLEAVGRRYGITRERVRQIEEVANARVRDALVACGVTPPQPLESYPEPYDERHKSTKRAWEREQRAEAKEAKAQAKAAAKAAAPKRPIGRPRKSAPATVKAAVR